MSIIANSATSSAESSDTVGSPGIATGWAVNTACRGNAIWKLVYVENLSSRDSAISYDFDQGRLTSKKIKQRIEHVGQQILYLGYYEDWRRGSKEYDKPLGLYLSEWQEVWAADGRNASAQWIKARDLVPGHHVLRLAYANEQWLWAEVLAVEPSKQEKYRNVPVHELVLIDGESYAVDRVLCRAASVPAAPVPPVKKRVFYPLKDFPLINFVPQPKTLSLAHAGVWYRKSAALLERCVGESLEPLARLRAMLGLKWRMREVAAKAAIETSRRKEFIAEHPLPTQEELVPDHERLEPEALKLAIEAAVQALSAPGDRCYSAFTGGRESHRVRTGHDYWVFDGNRWVQSATEPQDK